MYTILLIYVTSLRRLKTVKVQPAILSFQHTCDLQIWSKGPKLVQQGKAK